MNGSWARGAAPPPVVPAFQPEPPESERQFGAVLDLAVKIGTGIDTLTDIQRQALDLQLLEPDVRAPLIGSGVVPASGVLLLDLGAPAVGREWEVRRLMIVDGSNPSGQTSGGAVTASSNAYAAAAAGFSGLPAGAAMTGFSVTAAPASAPVSGQITVTGTSVPELYYELAIGTAGGSVSQTFPTPIPATAATVSVPAITGGSAYTVTVYGTTAVTGGTPGTAFWYAGIPYQSAPQAAIWRAATLPEIDRLGGENISIKAREKLFAVVSGANPGDTLIARADVVDIMPGRAVPVTTT